MNYLELTLPEQLVWSAAFVAEYRRYYDESAALREAEEMVLRMRRLCTKEPAK